MLNRHTLSNKERFAMVVSMALILFGFYLFLRMWAKADLGDLPPENYTSTTMFPLKTRILQYTNEHNKVPPSLDVIPTLAGFNNNTKDAWGNEIIMQTNGSIVKLISYGKDQRPGGTGDNLDVIGIFQTKKDTGEWVDENSGWEIEPLKQIQPVKPPSQRPY